MHAAGFPNLGLAFQQHKWMVCPLSAPRGQSFEQRARNKSWKPKGVAPTQKKTPKLL